MLCKVQLQSRLHCAEDRGSIPVDGMSCRLGVFSRSGFDVSPVVFEVVESVAALVLFHAFGDGSVCLTGVGARTGLA